MKKLLTALIVFTFIAIFLFSCTEKVENTVNEDTEPTEEVLTDADDEADTEGQDETEPETNRQITLYYYDVVKDRFKECVCEAVIRGELSADTLIGLLEENSGVNISYNKSNVKDRAVYVDFSSDGAPFTGSGSSGEAGILESVAVTLLKNLENIDCVYYTADGGAYQSGHVFIPLEQPYMVRADLEYIDEPAKDEKEQDIFTEASNDRELR